MDDLLSNRLDQLRGRIEGAGGDPDRIRVVAVTKGFPASAVSSALEVGLAEVGENYAQELVAKARELGSVGGLRWHFLGGLQTNKLRSIAPYVAVIQSVDRMALVDEIARKMPGTEVFVQVNLDSLAPAGRGGHGATTRGGCVPEEATRLVAACRERSLGVSGLMAVGAHGGPEAARPGFRWLAQLKEELGLAELSIGMSDDLEVAVEEGSTMVRIGRGLFGPRPGAV